MKTSKEEAITIIPNKNTTVLSYPSSNKFISVARIAVHGRHPAGKNEFFVEQKCHVLLYILKGVGKIMIEDKECRMAPEDVIIIDAGKKYYIAGDIEYMAATSPGYYPEQNIIVRR